MNMVERVARALARVMWESTSSIERTEDPSEYVDTCWGSYDIDARAAIEAMSAHQGVDALAIVQRIVGVPAFMMTTFGERPVVSIKFDDRKGVWAFLNALGDARKLVNAISPPARVEGETQ